MIINKLDYFAVMYDAHIFYYDLESKEMIKVIFSTNFIVIFGQFYIYKNNKPNELKIGIGSHLSYDRDLDFLKKSFSVNIDDSKNAIKLKNILHALNAATGTMDSKSKFLSIVFALESALEMLPKEELEENTDKLKQIEKIIGYIKEEVSDLDLRSLLIDKVIDAKKLSIKNRIIKLLSKVKTIDQKQEDLDKLINKMYEIRSSIVHKRTMSYEEDTCLQYVTQELIIIIKHLITYLMNC